MIKSKTPKLRLNFYQECDKYAMFRTFCSCFYMTKSWPLGIISAFFITVFSVSETLAQTISVNGANGPTNGIAQGSLTFGQKDLALFGFGVTAVGPLTITEFNIHISSPDNQNNYFGNYRLYKSADSIRSSDDLIVSSTVSWKKKNISNLCIEGLSEVYQDSVSKTCYYFLVADYTNSSGIVPGSIQFSLSSTQKADAIIHSNGSFNNFNIQGTSFLTSPPIVSVSAENNGTNGITPALITFGQKNIVLFGFGVNVKGVSTISQFNITSTNKIGSYFSNGKLYRSTDNIYSSDDLLISSIAINKNTNTSLAISNLAESFDGSSTRYYFFIADYTNNGTVPNNTIQFKFSAGQTSAAIVQSNPQSYSYNTFDITGQKFVFARTTIWLGNSDITPGNWNDAGNWSGGYVPGSTDIAYLGTQSFLTQPTVPGNATIGSILLGTVQPVTLTVDSAVTFNAGDIIQKATDASIVNVITGRGSIIVNNFQLTEQTSSATFTANRTSKVVSDIAKLTVNNVIIRSKTNGSRNDATFELAGGEAFINGAVQTINATASNTSTFATNSSSVVNLVAATPFNRSVTGNSVLNLLGSTIYNSSLAQAVDASVVYKDLSLAGSGIKTITIGSQVPFNLSGSLSIISPATIAYSSNVTAINIMGNFEGNSPLNSGSRPVSIAGNWTNTAVGTIVGDVAYIGSSDQIVGGLDYNNVTFLNGGLKQLLNFASVKGNLEVGSNTVLNTNDKLTLIANASGYANIKPLLNDADILGKVTVQSFIKGGTRGYTTLSSPVYDADPSLGTNTFTYVQLKKNMLVTGAGGSANGFDMGSVVSPFGPTIRRFKEEASPAQLQYYSIANIADVITAGYGFNFYFRGDRSNSYYKVNPPYAIPEDVVVEYSGNINKGNIRVPLPFTYYAGASDNGFNLVGNPYASVIDLQKLLAGTPFKTAWILKLDNTYAVYDVNLDIGTNGASRYIIPGQGFFVQADQPGRVLEFTEECKQTTNSSTRIMADKTKTFATISALAPKTTLSQYIKLQLKNEGSVFSDETIIVFNERSSDNRTIEDANYLGEGSVLLGSLSVDNQLLAINYFPKTEIDTEVKLQVNGEASGTYNLSLSANAFSDFSDILLHDKYLNKTISLKSTPSYSFLIDKNISTTYGSERFKIIFKKVVQEVTAKQSSFSSVVPAQDITSKPSMLLYPNPVVNQLYVKLDRKSGPVEMTVYNMFGQAMKSVVVPYSETITQNISDLNRGSYILKLRDSQSNSIIGSTKFIKE